MGYARADPSTEDALRRHACARRARVADLLRGDVQGFNWNVQPVNMMGYRWEVAESGLLWTRPSLGRSISS
jgi:hypothetical protein